MHDQRNPRGPSPRNPSPAQQDAQVQRSLLGLVLVERPVQLTIPEIVLELTKDPDNFAEKDSVERAVRDLVKVGLLHRHGPFVLLTRAAVHFEALEFGGA